MPFPLPPLTVMRANHYQSLHVDLLVYGYGSFRTPSGIHEMTRAFDNYPAESQYYW